MHIVYTLNELFIPEYITHHLNHIGLTAEIFSLLYHVRSIRALLYSALHVCTCKKYKKKNE
jgi:hypothetical protein